MKNVLSLLLIAVLVVAAGVAGFILAPLIAFAGLVFFIYGFYQLAKDPEN